MSKTLKRVGAVVTVLTITAGTYTVLSNVTTSTSTANVSFANVKAIRFDGGPNTIILTGSDSTSVTGTRAETHGLRGLKITERVTDDGTLIIKTRCPDWFATFRCDVKYTFDVPHNVSISGSISGDSASLSEIDGPVDLEADAGEIRATKLSGSVKLHSAAGSVTVDSPTGDLDLSSSAGSVDVTHAASAKVSADSSAGSVRLEFDREPELINAESSAGSVTVMVPRSDSSYDVDAETSAGSENVEIKTDSESNRKVKLRSSAGNVTMRYAP